MLANKQCIMIEGHWFNNSKIFSLLKNLEDTKLRIFFHNPDFYPKSTQLRHLLILGGTLVTSLLSAHVKPSTPGTQSTL